MFRGSNLNRKDDGVKATVVGWVLVMMSEGRKCIEDGYSIVIQGEPESCMRH